MRFLKKLLTIASLLAVAAGAAIYFGMRAPAAAVWQSAYALKACDYDSFDDAIDLELIVSGLTDEALGSPDLSASIAKTFGPNLGGMLASGFGAFMKPMISTMAHGAVKDFVRSCRLFKPPLDGPLANLQPLAEFLARPLGPETAAAIAWWHTQKLADAAARMTIPLAAGTLTVDLKRDDKGVWRVTGVPGALALLKKSQTP